MVYRNLVVSITIRRHALGHICVLTSDSPTYYGVGGVGWAGVEVVATFLSSSLSSSLSSQVSWCFPRARNLFSVPHVRHLTTKCFSLAAACSGCRVTITRLAGQYFGGHAFVLLGFKLQVRVCGTLIHTILVARILRWRHKSNNYGTSCACNFSSTIPDFYTALLILTTTL